MKVRARFWGIVLCLLFLSGTPALADVSVQPLLIDEQVLPRDAVTRTITLTNQTDRKQIVFATVNEITLGADGGVKEFISPMMTDRTDTVTSWIEITRARIELDPGESEEVPLTLRIHPFAAAGEYYAYIGFVPTNKRPTAEAVALAGDAAGVVLSVEVTSTAQESFSVHTVSADRLMVDPASELVTVGITNDGDLPIAPQGEIIFYNARGQEISAEPFNLEAVAVASGEQREFQVPITIPTDFGRYRAAVSVAHENVSISDATQFYVLPLPWLLGLLGLLLAITLTLTLLIKRSLHHVEGGDFHDGFHIPLHDNTRAQTDRSVAYEETLSEK